MSRRIIDDVGFEPELENAHSIHFQPQPLTVSGRLSLFAVLSGHFSKRLKRISPLNKKTWICGRTNYYI